MGIAFIFSGQVISSMPRPSNRTSIPLFALPASFSCPVVPAIEARLPACGPPLSLSASSSAVNMPTIGMMLMITSLVGMAWKDRLLTEDTPVVECGTRLANGSTPLTA